MARFQCRSGSEGRLQGLGSGHCCANRPQEADPSDLSQPRRRGGGVGSLRDAELGRKYTLVRTADSTTAATIVATFAVISTLADKLILN